MDKTPQGTTTAGPTVEYNIGAVPNVQLHIVLPFVLNTPVNGAKASGFGDAEIGVKYRFVQETRDRPQIGTFPMAEVATGDAGKGLGNGRTWFRLPLWAPERKQKTPMESTFFKMVGGRRIELLTSSVSRKRSPTELTARTRQPAEYSKGPRGRQRFCAEPGEPFESRGLFAEREEREHLLLPSAVDDRRRRSVEGEERGGQQEVPS